MEEFKDELFTTVDDGMGSGYSEVNPEEEFSDTEDSDDEEIDIFEEFDDEDDDFDEEPTDEELMAIENDEM